MIQQNDNQINLLRQVKIRLPGGDLLTLQLTARSRVEETSSKPLEVILTIEDTEVGDAIQVVSTSTPPPMLPQAMPSADSPEKALETLFGKNPTIEPGPRGVCSQCSKLEPRPKDPLFHPDICKCRKGGDQ